MGRGAIPALSPIVFGVWFLAICAGEHIIFVYCFLACEAGDSIKPGAQAPGSRNHKRYAARETGDSLKDVRLSPAIAGSRN